MNCWLKVLTFEADSERSGFDDHEAHGQVKR
jgi:hypothetical protein